MAAATKILMVDDRPENLLAMEAVLEPLDRELVRAASGEEALRRLMKEDFAVILLDVHMPGMDGFETATYIKGGERTRHIPIIFMTAISRHPASIFQGYESGAVDYLSKPFDPDVLRSKVAVFIELYEHRAALQALAAQQGALRRVATAIAADEDSSRVFAMVAEEVARLFDVGAGVVARADQEGQFVVLGAWARRAAAAPTLGAVLASAAMSAVRSSGMAARGRVEADAEPESGEQIVAPIRLGAQLWGVVAATAADQNAFPSDVEAQLAEFADLLGIALAGADSRRLAAQASSDPLTGLANHRSFQERLRAEVDRAQRHGRNLALALLDIDGFKAVNDAFGHQEGDRVLQDVAARLSDALRSGDLVARIDGTRATTAATHAAGLVARVGGDEFALVFVETDAVGAHAVAERARAHIRSAPLGAGCDVTVSIGICDLAHAADVDELIRFADGALYWAKEHGRDAVWTYSPEGVEELSAQERAERLARSQVLNGIRALARAVDARDQATQQHSDRVSNLAALLAEGLGWPPDRVTLLREAALVHDVGKIGVPDAILLKPERLSAEEYAAIKTHAALGAQIASGVLNGEQTAWLRGHHERYDGTGYPDGLAGDAIPEGAQLLAVADCWDVMTSERPYSPAMQPVDALAECRRQAGSQFAPEAVAALATPEFLRLGRIVQNEVAARAANERDDPGNESAPAAEEPDRIFEIVCECGDPQCAAPIAVRHHEYATGRAHQRRFIIRPGHEIPEVERVVFSTDRLMMVEKQL